MSISSYGEISTKSFWKDLLLEVTELLEFRKSSLDGIGGIEETKDISQSGKWLSLSDCFSVDKGVVETGGSASTTDSERGVNGIGGTSTDLGEEDSFNRSDSRACSLAGAEIEALTSGVLGEGSGVDRSPADEGNSLGAALNEVKCKWRSSSRTEDSFGASSFWMEKRSERRASLLNGREKIEKMN
jgi:hypothetical protein